MNKTQPNTQEEIEKRGSFGNIMEYGTLLFKEKEDILLIRKPTVRMASTQWAGKIGWVKDGA